MVGEMDFCSRAKMSLSKSRDVSRNWPKGESDCPSPICVPDSMKTLRNWPAGRIPGTCKETDMTDMTHLDNIVDDPESITLAASGKQSDHRSQVCDF